MALLGDPAVFERGEPLFAPQLRIIEILRDLAEPHAHAALAAKVVEGVHRAEKRLARQLLGGTLAPGQRKQIPIQAAAPEAVRTVAAAPKAVHQAVPPTADLKLLRHRRITRTRLRLRPKPEKMVQL